MNELPENAILKLIVRTKNKYTSFSYIYLKVDWLISRKELYNELDFLVKSGLIRIKGINTELYIGITTAGKAFLARCA